MAGSNVYEYIKMALFLEKTGDIILKERLEYLLKNFETRYKQAIEIFRLGGDASFFIDNKEEILSLIEYALDI